MHFSYTPNVLQSSRDVKYSFFKPQVFGPYSVTTWNLKTTYYPHQSQEEPKNVKSQYLKHTQLQGYLPTPISTQINWWIFLIRLKWMLKQRAFSHAWRNHPDAEHCCFLFWFFNKLYYCAIQNPNSHCPWSSKRETHGVHRFSCLTSKSKMTGCNVQPCDIPEEF